VYQEGLKVQHDYVNLHINLGVLLAEMGEREAAVASYLEAIRLDPLNGTACYNLGNVLSDQGDLAGAIAAYWNAANNDPDTYEVRYNLANALAKADEIDEAVSQYRYAARLSPDRVDPWLGLGACLTLRTIEERSRSGAEAALEAYAQALKIQPRNREALRVTRDLRKFLSSGKK
jgi:tetratricopeptide (TPR) repeat protein